MAGVKSLGGIFKLFELLGLQHFSFKDLKDAEAKQSRTKTVHKVYFGFLFVFFSSMATNFLVHIFMSRSKFAEAENFVKVIIGILLSFGILVGSLVGLIESYLKRQSLAAIVLLATEISKLCASDFEYQICYQPLKRRLVKKIASLYFFCLVLSGIIIATTISSNGSLLGVLFGLLTQIFFVTVAALLIVYVDLVNFQLENLLEIVQNHVIDCGESLKAKEKRERALSVRKCYHLIFEMAQLANKVLRFSQLLVLTILILGMINSVYENLIEGMITFNARKRSRKILAPFYVPLIAKILLCPQTQLTQSSSLSFCLRGFLLIVKGRQTL